MDEIKFKVKDVVRITFEGTITHMDDVDDDEGWFTVAAEDGDIIEVPFDVGTVEILESPVTVFGPGQVVRTLPRSDHNIFGREYPRYTYTLSEEGYIQHGTGTFRHYDNLVAKKGSFTSEHYGLVEVD